MASLSLSLSKIEPRTHGCAQVYCVHRNSSLLKLEGASDCKTKGSWAALVVLEYQTVGYDLGRKLLHCQGCVFTQNSYRLRPRMKKKGPFQLQPGSVCAPRGTNTQQQ